MNGARDGSAQNGGANIGTPVTVEAGPENGGRTPSLATTPGTYGRFIGRVGALAVALGVGAAIATSPGFALAQEGAAGGGETTGSANAGTKTDDSATPGSPSPEQKTPDPADNNNNAAAGDDDADDVDADDVVAVDEHEIDLGDDDPDDFGENTPDEKNDKPLARENEQSETHKLFGAQTTTTAEPEVRPIDGDTFDTTTESTPPQQDSAIEDVAVHAIDTAGTAAFAALSTPAAPTRVTTGLGGLVNTVLSVLGLGPQAATGGPTAPPQPPMLWAVLGWVRREIGNLVAPFLGGFGTTTSETAAAQDVSVTSVSPLATEEQLAAERLAAQTVATLPVALMKIVLRQQFLSAAKQQYGADLHPDSLAALDKAVEEYAMAAAFQQQLLNSMTPTVVTQVAPPHIWFGQDVAGGRILYDNPDTIYRFMGVNGASEYVIRGQFLNWSDKSSLPADTTFSVLEGLAGTTSSILTVDENFVVDDDGRFVITVSTEPANGRPNHLQLTPGSTIIAARNTLGDWATEDPMTLEIERVGGPPNSLFAQVGGFAFLGSLVSSNPLLTTLVSLVPPLPYLPPTLRGLFTAAILVVRGASQEAKYMALASTDPDTGAPRPVNTVSEPSSNAEFLANQLQSNGHFLLEDGQALVLTIDPGRANYFIVPVYDIWTITDDYWNKQTSLNNAQAIANPDGTYTVVISPTDPGVTNWIDTGGLHQGTISIRFQDLDPDPDNLNPPRILDQQVIDVADAASFFADDPKYVVNEQQRAEQLAARKAGYDRRWAPYPQP